MTDATRLAALERVAEAARALKRAGEPDVSWNDYYVARKARDDALAALDALPASQPQPAGEVVTLAVWEDREGGIAFMSAGSLDDRTSENAWRDGFLTATRLGTVTLPITREGGA